MATKRSNEEFLIQVKADIDQATAELRKFTREMDNTGKAGGASSSGVNKLSGTFGALITAATAYLTLNTANRLLKEADQWNQLQARIRSATRETGDYATVSRQITDISQRNGQALETTVSLFQSLARTAPELRATNADMLRLTNTVQQLGVISGTTTEQQRAGLLQFTQGLAGGVLRAEEFNSIIENLPELANRIAKGMGLTVGQLRQAVLQGKVLSKDVFDAIQSQSDDISKQFDELPDSLTRSGAALNTSFSQFLGSLNEAVSGSNTLATIYRTIAGYLDELSDNLTIDQMVEKIKELQKQNQEMVDSPSWFKNEEELIRRNNALIDKYKAKINELRRQASGNPQSANFVGPPEPPPPALISSDEQKALDDYQKSIQKLTDRLDPASASTRQLTEDLDLLNRQFFVDESISFERYDQLVTALLGSDLAAKEVNNELKQLDKELQRLIESIDPAVRETNDLGDALLILDRALENGLIDDAAFNDLVDKLKNLNKENDDAFKGMEAAIRGWGDTFTNTLVDMVMQGELSFKRLADSIIADLLRIAIQTNITQPLLGAIFPTQTPASWNQNSLVSPFHSGGIAGSGIASRSISPWVFANAPRYHTGGIAGLASNEVPAILQRGEEVLTRDDPRHVLNQRTGPIKVSIENKGQPVELERAEARVDADGLVISVFTRDLREGGPMSRSLQGTFGLNRK